MIIVNGENDMKKELSLLEIKKITFEILKHFALFCEQHNICFFLSNGTLLGAVKYNGFIPWDDDVDVLVPREDYNRLIALYQDSERYQLFSTERDAKFYYTFAKLCDMSTVKEEINIDNGISLGIDIDIFPLDYCTEHLCTWWSRKQIKWYQIGCILSKFRSSKGKLFYKRILIDYCRFKGFNYFQRRLMKKIKRESKRGNSHAGCLIWPIYGEREVLPLSVFESTVSVIFEGIQFQAPIGYDTYLRSLYGDYENDPPIEMQRSHHKYMAYRR